DAIGTSLSVSFAPLTFQARSSTSFLAGGVSVGPMPNAGITMGAGRRINSGGNLVMAGGRIDAMNGGNQLLFEGSLSVSGESISQPPAVLNVGGSGSAFHVGS